MKNFSFALLTKYYSDDQIMADKMNWACGTYWKMIVGYWGNLEDRDSLEHLCVEREDNIKVDLQYVGWDVDWIYLHHDRDNRRTLLNAIMKLRVT
jgi:hypothetical protein